MDDLKKLIKWCKANALECERFEKARADATEYEDAIELRAMATTYRKVASKIKKIVAEN